MNRLLLLLLILSVGLAGCVRGPGVSVAQFTPSKYQPVENKTLVNKPFEEVWNSLEVVFVCKGYTIKSANKDSRIITLKLPYFRAEELVSIGSMLRAYSYRGKTAYFSYNLAEDHQYLVAEKWESNSRILPADKRVSVHTYTYGDIDVRVIPKGEQSTEVEVNVHYSFGRHPITGYYYKNYADEVVKVDFKREEIKTIKFSTNEKKQVDLGEPSLEPATPCSTGKIERDILDIVRSM